MINWHAAGRHKKCPEGCMSGAFRTALSDVHALTKYLLCDRADVPELTRVGANKRFWTYTQACLNSTCSAPVLGRQCGWGDKAPNCPVLVSNLRYAWKRYEKKISGTNSETGEPFYRSEFVLHVGTAKEFPGEFTDKYKMWLPHFFLDRFIKNNKRILNDHVQRTELTNPKTLQSVSDYAAQPTLPREFTPTCNAKQKMNNCVTLLSFKPHEVNRFIQKRGKREARVVSGVRNHCIVVYGIFDPAIKTSAQQYNM